MIKATYVFFDLELNLDMRSSFACEKSNADLLISNQTDVSDARECAGMTYLHVFLKVVAFVQRPFAFETHSESVRFGVVPVNEVGIAFTMLVGKFHADAKPTAYT